METALNRVREFHRRIGAPVAEGPELLACQRAVQSGKCRVGMLECWNVGMLECWNVGMLECWNVGMVECWNGGVLECFV